MVRIGSWTLSRFTANNNSVAPEATGLVRDVWSVLLDQMKRRAEARQRFAAHLSDEMKQRLEVLERETITGSKRCLELGSALLQEIQRSYRAVEEALKVYHHYQGERSVFVLGGTLWCTTSTLGLTDYFSFSFNPAKCARAEEEFNKAKAKGQLKKGEKVQRQD